MSFTTVNAIATAHRLRVVYRANVNVGTPLPGWSMIVNRFAGTIDPAAAFAVPSSAGATCDRGTTGALALPGDPGSGHVFRVTRARVTGAVTGQSSLPPGCLVLCDRYTETAGVSWSVNTAQAVTMPALPARAPTGGDGVWLCMEGNTIPGSGTNQTLTTTYTNQAGATKTTAVTMAPDGKMGNNAFIMPLAAGDTGVRAVTSAQWGTAPSTTAGNLGYALLEPLAFFDTSGRANQANPVGAELEDWLDCALPRVNPQACLELLYVSTAGFSIPLNVELDLVID